MINQPKVLIFDIETAPMLAYVWGRDDQNISINQIYQDWSVLAWGAKWLGTPASQILYKDVSCNKDLSYDKNILEPLWKLLDEADIVITQNGKNFDSPKLNARFILNGMNPPSPYKHLDTYQLVRRVAKFTSNSLEYLTDKLCVKYKKLSHKKFPGMNLWKECMKGNNKAWEEMKIYNIQDVLSTEELYMKIRSWTPTSMPQPHHITDISQGCSICGVKGKMMKKGFSFTKTAKYQRFKCTSCGSWSQGDKVK